MSRSNPSREPGDVLFKKTRRRVLAWLLGHPDEAFYLREIVRHSGAAHGAVQRELQALTGAGLLVRSVRGRHTYFQARRDSPIFAELQRIMIKTAGAADVLSRALAPLRGKIQAAFIFGSAARTELTAHSDIDLLVIGDTPFEAVARAIGPVQQQLGREVNPTVYGPAEFHARVRQGRSFLRTAVSEPKVFLIGGPDELGRLGAQRLAGGGQAHTRRDHRPAGRHRPRPRR